MTNRAQPHQSPVSILTYHSIDASGSVVSTHPDTFREQMRLLSEWSSNVISLKEVAACLHERRPFPPNAVAITFDDGYRNVYSEAFPILGQYGFAATVFLVTDYCGKDNDWPGNSPSIGCRPLLSWSEIQELHRAGFEFGSHTVTHADLTRIPIRQVEEELRASKAKIEEAIGAQATTFAYPYGHYNAEIKALVERHFQAACSTRLGKVTPAGDPYLLSRVDMYYLSGYNLFRKLPTKTMDWYLEFRHLLREIKGMAQR